MISSLVARAGEDVESLRAKPIELPSALREIVKYRKSGVSLNQVVGCAHDCAYCVRHLSANYAMKALEPQR